MRRGHASKSVRERPPSGLARRTASLFRSIPSWLLAFAVLTAACESPTSSLVELEGPASDDFSTVLAEELDLTRNQRDGVDDEIRRHDSPNVRPASLWFLAVHFQQTLDDERKARLFRLAHQEREKHLQRLVSVYGGCPDLRPSANEHAAASPLAFVHDVMTEEQRAEASEIRQSHHEQLLDLQEQHRSGALSREVYAAEAEALREAMTAAILGLLTEDQQAMLRRKMAAHGSSAQNHGVHIRHAMTEAMGLSERQLGALDLLHRHQCGVVHDLLTEARAGDLTREEYQRRLLRLLDHKFSVLSNVLDERQLETARIHDALLMIHAGRHVPHASPDDSTTR